MKSESLTITGLGANAAASVENKHTWLSNDLLRMLVRISEDVLERGIVGIINFYDEKPIFSGYSLQDRVQIIKRGISDYRERLARIKSCGGNPHLRADQTLLERTRKKLLEQVTWYKGWDQVKRSALTARLRMELDDQAPSKGKYIGTVEDGGCKGLQAATSGSTKLEVITAIFVDRTTGGELLKLMREAEKKLSSVTGYRVKVVEKNGPSSK